MKVFNQINHDFIGDIIECFANLEFQSQNPREFQIKFANYYKTGLGDILASEETVTGRRRRSNVLFEKT
jgi:hypothetical protein